MLWERQCSGVFIALILCFLIQPDGSRAEETSAFKIPNQIKITGFEKADSLCFDFALHELARLLGRVDVLASTETQVSKDGNWMVVIGETPSESSAPSSDLKKSLPDGYILDIGEDQVSIASKSAKGILNGVYDLAERMGYLFLYPGIEGEWPPLLEGDTPTIPIARVLANPRFPHRGIFNGNSNEEWAGFYAKMRFNALCQPTERALAEKLGLRIEVGGHDLDNLIPPDLFEKNPDMFRMDQPEDFFGKRRGDFNLCVTSPAAKETVQKAYREKLKPYLEDGIYAWHTWPEDLPAEGWCYCPTCRSFEPTDQAMLAMRMLAEVIREDQIPMRVPVLAYHDTMFPGKKIDAPKEAFLLFAPRERCYGHSLTDPECGINAEYLRSLEEWHEKFKNTNDAHTFEYYLDRVLFRGLCPFLPQVILDDMKTYRENGIESHICLQTGSAFEPPLMMQNLLVFSRGMWNEELSGDEFIHALAKKILPEDPDPWIDYFQKRAEVSAKTMQWEDESVGWADYRWISETTLPIGEEMVKVYRQGSEDYDDLADHLESAIQPDWLDRVKDFAHSEIARTRFESQELKSMMLQQDAVNHVGDYLNTENVESLKTGVDLMKQTIRQLEVAAASAEDAGFTSGTYYFMFNRWMTKELNEKIAKWEAVTGAE
ncbi:MAG: DUF4838 domain-containing protein [Candidatus Omnitrophica bacterium]|nr:DUF4838 domain-containing protein [Candidatus Omnitrophota bacterium]